MLHMLRFLGQRFSVDLVAPALEGWEDARRRLEPSCRTAWFIPPRRRTTWRARWRLGPYDREPALAAHIAERVATGTYAAIQIEKPAMIPYLPAGLTTPLILDTWAFGLTGPLRSLRNAPTLVRRLRALIQLARFAAFDGFCWPPTHSILVVSPEDRERCQRRFPARSVRIVPNGVDCEAFRPPREPHSDPPRIVFTGDMSFPPNVDAARALATRIFPRLRARYPNIELHLVGRRPDASVSMLSGPGIEVTGEVEEMAPYLRSATVYAAPLRAGAGTRTKLLEAMAAGLPIVTTKVGIEGIEAAHDQEIFLVDSVEASVQALEWLLRSPADRERLGRAARRRAEERYDWDYCLRPLESLYDSLLSRHAA